jgi:hypothetical protein
LPELPVLFPEDLFQKVEGMGHHFATAFDSYSELVGGEEFCGCGGATLGDGSAKDA